MIWYKNNNSDIVVSTRIRLARNVDKTPFPNALKDTKEVTEKIKNAVLGGNSTLAKDFAYGGGPYQTANHKRRLCT